MRIAFATLVVGLLSTSSPASQDADIIAVQLAGKVDVISWSPDSRSLAALVDGDNQDSIILLDTANENRQDVLFASSPALLSPVFSRDGTKLAVAAWDYGENGDSAVLIWDLQKREQIQVLAIAPRRDLGCKFSSEILTVAFSPDGRYLSAGTKLVGESPIAGSHIGGEICAWEVETGTLLWSNRSVHTDIVYDVTYSPDGETLASAGIDKVIRVWDPTSGRLRRSLFGAGWDGISTLCFARNGSLIISAGIGREEGGVIRAWDLDSGKQLAAGTRATTKFAANETCRVCASADGSKIFVIGNVTAGESPKWQLQSWNASIERESRQVILEHPGYARDVAAARDGRRLAVATADGQIIFANISSRDDASTRRKP